METPTHFVWNADKPTEGEAVFITGNPGATQRLLTMDQLATIRDVVLPLDQLIASELRGRLIRYAEEGEDQAFIAMDPIVGVENTYKRGLGRMRALTDAGFMATKAAAEADFMQRYAAANASGSNPWEALKTIQPLARELYAPTALLEGGTAMGTTSVAGGSQLFQWARAIVRGAQERAKPSDQRLAEFADSRLPGVESGLFAEKPTYPDLEQIRLEWWLSKTREWLTVDSPHVRTPAGSRKPRAAVGPRRRRHEIGRSDGAPRPVDRRSGGGSGVRRSDDPVCAVDRRRRPRRPRGVGEQGQGPPPTAPRNSWRPPVSPPMATRSIPTPPAPCA